jgi:hypothetical protein
MTNAMSNILFRMPGPAKRIKIYFTSGPQNIPYILRGNLMWTIHLLFYTRAIFIPNSGIHNSY